MKIWRIDTKNLRFLVSMFGVVDFFNFAKMAQIQQRKETDEMTCENILELRKIIEKCLARPLTTLYFGWPYEIGQDIYDCWILLQSCVIYNGDFPGKENFWNLESFSQTLGNIYSFQAYYATVFE